MLFSTRIEVLSAIAAKTITPEEGAVALVELSKPKAPRTEMDVLSDLANGTIDTEYAELELAEIAANAKPKPNRKGGSGKRAATILGYSATSVVRWLGREGVSFAEAKVIVDTYCGESTLADATLRAQLFAGRKGQRGDVAPITEEQALELGKTMLNDSLANALMV